MSRYTGSFISFSKGLMSLLSIDNVSFLSTVKFKIVTELLNRKLLVKSCFMSAHRPMCQITLRFRGLNALPRNSICDSWPSLSYERAYLNRMFIALKRSSCLYLVDSDTVIQFVGRSTDCFVILAAVVECAKCTSVLVYRGKLTLGSGREAGLCLKRPCHFRSRSQLSP
jgi:hypothetical protein